MTRNLGAHMRGDGCPSRPLEYRERCQCGRASWDLHQGRCRRCTVGELVDAGLTILAVIVLLELPPGIARRELGSYRLMRRRAQRMGASPR
jgi:hypothetical protein